MKMYTSHSGTALRIQLPWSLVGKTSEYIRLKYSRDPRGFTEWSPFQKSIISISILTFTSLPTIEETSENMWNNNLSFF